MIRICPKCGALLLDDTDACSFCSSDAPERNGFAESDFEPVGAVAHSSSSPARSTRAVATSHASGAAATAAPALDAPDPAEIDWRGEVSRRLEQYRARRGHLRHDDSQSGLPFHDSAIAAGEDAASAEAEHRERLAAQARARLAQRQRQPERVEIRIQPELDFSASPDDRAHPQTALVPVASLAERRWAGALDVIFLAFTCAGFLGLFRSLGGQITVAKTDVVVYALVAYFFYVFYVSLFTVLAGSTPGMQLRGLAVVRLDGSLPDTRQLLWRSFGYLLSGATLMLGFLWALWDEDRFTWQDRISQTYITAAVPLSDFDSLGAHAASHRLAHK